MKKLLVLLLTVLAVPIAAAESKLTPGEEQIKEALEKFMERVSSGQADEGFTFLFKEFWKEKETIGQATVAMQRQYRNLIGRAEDAMGQPVPGGHDFLGVKRLGGSVVKFVYLQKNELTFLPWAFTFYKPSRDWRLSHIEFPDLVSDDIKDFTVVVMPSH
jgi:hypothetical protein